MSDPLLKVELVGKATKPTKSQKAKGTAKKNVGTQTMVKICSGVPLMLTAHESTSVC